MPKSHSSDITEFSGEADASMPSFPIVDTHVHFFDPGELPYPWLDRVPDLKKPHLPADYDRAVVGTNVERLVFVEVDIASASRRAEVDWVAALAQDDRRIGAIVASVALEDGRAVVPFLEDLASAPLVRGVRRLIQGEADPAFCIRPGFVEGVRLLADYGFTFDICIRHPQLASVPSLVRACPEVRFVLDHIGKPGIRDGLFDPWRRHMAELADLPNVWCKMSGVVTEANPSTWTVGTIRPYVEHAIACFGFDRTMFGSDWPVCNLAASHSRWVEALDEILAGTSAEDLRKLYRDTAAAFYHLT
jgi:L-fuconolactonase